MSLADIKKLRAETGASLSECKRALEVGDTFEQAIKYAKEFAAEREEQELVEANAQQKQKAEFYAAEKKKDAFVESLTTLQGVYEKAVRSMLDETHDDWEYVRTHFESIGAVNEANYAKQLAGLNPKSDWSAETDFRSDATLCGSSKVVIVFECVQDAKVQFTLDMGTGRLSDLRDWHPSLNMPGEDPTDPEPLGVWYIYSEDTRFEIHMQEANFCELYVDNEWIKNIELPTYSEVEPLLKVLTNIAIRDLWISAR